MGALGPCIGIFHEDVLPERWRQLKEYGPQRLPDGTNHQDDGWLATYYRGDLAADPAPTWREHILARLYTVLAQGEREPLREALVALAATAVAWVEDLDNRSGDRAPLPPDPAVLDEGALLGVAA